MKHILSILALTFVFGASAQQNATFQVSGNCGMCKSRIEKAAKEAGATDAKWNKESQQLTVSFASGTSVSAIQQKVAAVGHDNAGAKASDDAYNKLHGCCKYDRAASTKVAEKESCCSDGGSCKKDNAKTAKTGKSGKSEDCSKSGKCEKSADCSKADKKMDCCKDGKCSMPDHDGKDCCKKS